MAGREGLIDTVKTSETGYIQRKLIKALEDCKVAYDRSVQMPEDPSYSSGEDGMDACSIEQQFFPTMPIDSYSSPSIPLLPD
jgi:DNA-directed RNA polymerase II subunit RPB1